MLWVIDYLSLLRSQPSMNGVSTEQTSLTYLQNGRAIGPGAAASYQATLSKANTPLFETMALKPRAALFMKLRLLSSAFDSKDRFIFAVKKMAEVGIAASIITLAGAFANLGMTFYSVADREARVIANKISLYSHSLTALSKLLDRQTSESIQLSDVARNLITVSESVLAHLSRLTRDLVPKRSSKAQKSTMSNFVARVGWLLRKPKVVFIRSSIESFKATLVLLVATMDYTEAVDRKASESIRSVV